MAELLAIFVDNIAPILIIAGIGYVVGRHLKISPQPISKLLFFVLSPALVFQSIATSAITSSELLLLTISVIIFVLMMTVGALLLLRLSHADRVQQVSVVMGAICPNNGNFGLPLIALAFNSEVVARAAVIFVIVTISNYSIGVFLASSGRKPPLEAMRNILGVPSVYAAALGLLLNFTSIDLPFILAQPVQRLSQATVPMMLLMLGLQLSVSTQIVRLRLVGVGVGLRLLVSPFLAAVLAVTLLPNESGMVALIMQASMPVAVVTIILATEYELDRQLSLSMIFASTLLSPITLSVLIFILRRLVPSAL